MGLRRCLAGLVEFLQHLLGDCIERGKNIVPSLGAGFETETSGRTVVQKKLQIRDRGRVRQVAFVVLEDQGNLIKGQSIISQVFSQSLQSGKVFRHAFRGRVRNIDDAVHALEDQLPGGIIADLTGNGVEHEAGGIPIDDHRVDGQKIEKQSAVGGGGQGHQIPALVTFNAAVDVTQVRRLSTHRCAAVHDLERDFLGFMIDDGHTELVGGVWSGAKAGDFPGNENELIPDAGGKFRLSMENSHADGSVEEKGSHHLVGAQGEASFRRHAHALGEHFQ